ncbi:hypothetical protein TSTA_033300 [Talaromyces stipitatus ATCC 10500]|uniref:Ferric oxidoreductase domain-containing protein n=1 Tax=Talaromyces stipitatus (strain ATCC 10500 / CBS 375.48 / QM 6759 / NRRL 1006) TaxID=441959 RepID=B8M5V7_TALSN|nr:uncharacterized protein TSTA_033300 [Talaromyces stipitatus ATCC 10500]EED20084.1 hypothetical protein TSTA_033300 [Talaromyces stipitatus ATCC 10500]
MAWPYRFILSLSDEELERRRTTLDNRGHYAQLSALILLGAFFLFSLGKGNRFEYNRGKSWWDVPAIKGASETRRQYAVALSWLLWLVTLSIWRTDDVFFKRIRDSDVQYGLAGTSFAILILVLGRTNVWKLRDLIGASRPEARRQLFYVVHLVLVGIFYGLAYSHVKYARPFVLEAMGAATVNLYIPLAFVNIAPIISKH